MATISSAINLINTKATNLPINTHLCRATNLRTEPTNNKKMTPNLFTNHQTQSATRTLNKRNMTLLYNNKNTKSKAAEANAARIKAQITSHNSLPTTKLNHVSRFSPKGITIFSATNTTTGTIFFIILGNKTHKTAIRTNPTPKSKYLTCIKPTTNMATIKQDPMNNSNQTTPITRPQSKCIIPQEVEAISHSDDNNPK